MRVILTGNLARPVVVVLSPGQARRLGVVAPGAGRWRWFQLWRWL